MKDVDLALTQISTIRAQLAASTRFLGLAPEFNLLMGVFAVLIAAAQSFRPEVLANDNLTFIAVWAVVLVASFGVAVVEAIVRARRLHAGMASAMLSAALLKVMPFKIAACVITWAICMFARDSAWLIPGVWQILIGLLGFSVISSLPRQIIWVAGWYVFCGAVVLAWAGSSGTLSPWMMGIPFGIGQIAVAFILNQANGANSVRT